MRTTADLNQIIDKIAENHPARFDASTQDRAEIPRSNAPCSPDAPPAKSPKCADANDASTNSRSFAPRLAADSASLATPSTRSARTRRRTPSAYSSDERVHREKVDKTVKSSAIDAEKRAAKEVDEEIKRTQRRRQIDPTTCERDYSTDEIEFMKALDDYKRASGRMFPTCSEILEVFKSLGYVKAARAESTDEEPNRNARPKRAATPAFLSDEENDAFEFDAALVLGIA